MELNAKKLEGDLSFDGGRGLIHDATRAGDWCQTYSGRRFYPADPRAEDLDMASIIQSVATKSRYNGHCLFYSVAEHSVLISKLVPPEQARAALIHDVPEIIISDIIRPVKRILGKANDIFKLEDMIWERAVAPFFGIDPALPRETIEMDTAICVLERAVLHPRADDWHLPFPEPKAIIQGLEWFEAGEAFCKRYGELWGAEAGAAAHAQWFKLMAADSERLRVHIEERMGANAEAKKQCIAVMPYVYA